jgi:hypothetical protein
MNAWRADPLIWGHGPRVFEVFLEPTCPFSVRAFGKLEDLLDKAALAHVLERDCALHSGRLDPRRRKDGRESVMAAVAAHREEFEFDRHCSGPNLDATPNDIIRRSSAIAA